MDPSYARIANPTTTYLEERVRQITGATSVTALNTGMAAIHYALTAVSGAGLNIVASKHLFGNSVSLIRDTLGSFGVEPRFVDFTKPEEVEAQIDDKTAALFFEIITNPQLFVADIKKLSEIAHRKGVPLIADTTIVPFPAFHAVDFGVDIEVVSSTKYISGGGTGLGGLLIDYGKFDWSQSPSPALQNRTKRVGKKLAFTARVKTELVTNLGSLMTPQVAYMETLGLDTLDIRFRRQAETTLWLAQQCQALPEIMRVNYTGLEENPFYELSKAQFGPGPLSTNCRSSVAPRTSSTVSRWPSIPPRPSSASSPQSNALRCLSPTRPSASASALKPVRIYWRISRLRLSERLRVGAIAGMSRVMLASTLSSVTRLDRRSKAV